MTHQEFVRFYQVQNHDRLNNIIMFHLYETSKDVSRISAQFRIRTSETDICFKFQPLRLSQVAQQNSARFPNRPINISLSNVSSNLTLASDVIWLRPYKTCLFYLLCVLFTNILSYTLYS